MKKQLVSYEIDCYYGIINGLFITTQSKLKKVYSKEIYFGEILGKHSEIIHKFEEDHFEIKSEDQDLIEKLEAIFGNTLVGYNPIEILNNQ